MTTDIHPEGGTTMHTGIRTRRALARLAPVLAIALLVAACGGSGSGIKISDAWARTSPMVAGAGAAYMVIENTGSAADALVGGSSDVATAVEVHETVAMSPDADGVGRHGRHGVPHGLRRGHGRRHDDGHAEDRPPRDPRGRIQGRAQARRLPHHADRPHPRAQGRREDRDHAHLREGGRRQALAPRPRPAYGSPPPAWTRRTLPTGRPPAPWPMRVQAYGHA